MGTENLKFYFKLLRGRLGKGASCGKLTSGLHAPIAHSLRPAALGGLFFRTSQRFLVQTYQLLGEKFRILHWSVVTLNAV